LTKESLQKKNLYSIIAKTKIRISYLKHKEFFELIEYGLEEKIPQFDESDKEILNEIKKAMNIILYSFSVIGLNRYIFSVETFYFAPTQGKKSSEATQ
jgi:hypothetical protein